MTSALLSNKDRVAARSPSRAAHKRGVHLPPAERGVHLAPAARHFSRALVESGTFALQMLEKRTNIRIKVIRMGINSW